MAQNTASSSRYQHRSLRNADSIRVLHLLPGTFDDHIHVELVEVTLSQPPSYEALSYVWGSPTPTDPISCHNEELLVTANCIAAMRWMRHREKHRVLWVDAVCIDQNSLDERNHQVRLMGDIYSTAMRVIIWLGERSEISDFLIFLVKGCQTIVGGGKRPKGGKWRLTNPTSTLRRRVKQIRALENGFKDLQEGWTTNVLFGSICDRPWFTRKWAIQEFVLSRESYFQCGDTLFNAPKFFATIHRILSLQLQKKHDFPYLQQMTEAFMAYSNTFNDLRTLVTGGKGGTGIWSTDTSILPVLLLLFGEGRYQNATDPKDAVFGLYGLAQRMNINVPQPDYSQPVELIYTEAAKAVIVHDKSLNLLLETYESDAWPELPSWVPDWNTQPKHGLSRLITEILPNFPANKTPARFVFLSEGKLMLVRGCFVDSIMRRAGLYFARPQILGEFPQYEPGPGSKLSWLQIIHMEAYAEFISMASLVMSQSGVNNLYALCRTLVPHISKPPRLVERLGIAGFYPWLRCYDPYLPLIEFGELELLDDSIPWHIIDDVWDRIKQGKTTSTIEPAEAEDEYNYETVHQRIKCNRAATAFSVLASLHCGDTRCFITSKGLLGKGLKAIQEGDLVALIAGADMPVILRKQGDIYHMKGPAYIHDIMQGEMWPEDENNLIDIILS